MPELKQGGEPWSRLVPTFGVTYLCCVGCRQPSCGRALEQAAPGGPQPEAEYSWQERTQLCLASMGCSPQYFDWVKIDRDVTLF